MKWNFSPDSQIFFPPYDLKKSAVQLENIGSSARYRRARRDTPTACTVPIRFAGAENCFIRFLEIGRINLLGSFFKGEAKKASNYKGLARRIQRMEFLPSCWKKTLPLSAYGYHTLFGVLRFEFWPLAQGARKSQLTLLPGTSSQGGTLQPRVRYPYVLLGRKTVLSDFWKSDG